jgi:DNA-binding MurR/RpiR family transcriptional regulator
MNLPKNASASYLPADSVVAERIAEIYPELSQALRAFADFVLSEPIRVAHMSINETVTASGVSVATANRFARKLGFDGYAQFRAEVIQGFESVFAPVERLKSKLSEGSSVHNVIAASIEEDLDNLTETIRNLDVARAEQAVDMLLNAENIFILAFDNAAALANIFAHRLELADQRVRMIDNGGGTLSAARNLSRFTRKDVVVAIAFPRYMRDTVDLTRAVGKRGIPILAITDDQTSPLASLGTLTLYVRARRSFSSTSDTAILALLEALAAGVAARSPGATEAAQKFADFAYPWLIAPERGRS